MLVVYTIDVVRLNSSAVYGRQLIKNGLSLVAFLARMMER